MVKAPAIPLDRVVPVAVAMVLSWASAAPVRAAENASAVARDVVVDRVVISTDHQPRIIVSLSRSARQAVLNLNAEPLAVAVADVDHDGRPDLSALLPHRQLLVWLNSGDGGFAQLQPRTPLNAKRSTRSRSHGWRIHRSPLEHALRFGADTHARRSAPTTQGTPSGFAGLHDSPIVQAAPPSRFALAPPPDRLPTSGRAGRRESRGPPCPPAV